MRRARCDLPPQIRTGNGHADGYDARIVRNELSYGGPDLFYRFGNMLLVNGGQVGEGNTIAFQVEHCDLHQTSCEFHADDMVFRAIEIQADGTTILIAFHVSGFFDNVSEQ